MRIFVQKYAEKTKYVNLTHSWMGGFWPRFDPKRYESWSRAPQARAKKTLDLWEGICSNIPKKCMLVTNVEASGRTYCYFWGKIFHTWNEKMRIYYGEPAYILCATSVKVVHSSLANAEGTSRENWWFSARACAVHIFVQKYAANRKYAKVTHSRMIGFWPRFQPKIY